MIRIAVCDDEIYVTAQIENKIMQLKKRYNLDIKVDVFYDGKSLLQIPLHRITDSASNGSVFPVVTEHFSASSDHAFL